MVFCYLTKIFLAFPSCVRMMFTPIVIADFFEPSVPQVPITSKLFISISGSRNGVLPRMIGVILPLPPKLQVVGKARRIEARTTVPQVIMVTEIIRMVVKEPGRMVVEEGNAMTVRHVLERVIKSGRNLRVTRRDNKEDQNAALLTLGNELFKIIDLQ